MFRFLFNDPPPKKKPKRVNSRQISQSRPPFRIRHIFIRTSPNSPHFTSDVKWSELKWVTVKFSGTKVPYTLGRPYTEGTLLYCDYFIWCVSCALVVLTCFVMCGWVDVCMFVFCNLCFGNMGTCIYCVLYCLYRVFVLFRLCIFILICFVCTTVRTTATEWRINCSNKWWWWW
jgi:hypothetical protein